MKKFDLAIFKAPKFSLQDLSFDSRLTLDIGKIVPVAYWEVFPSDEFDCKLQQLTRFMPMPAPVMQRYDVYLDAHFVPYRLLKNQYFNSEKFFNLRENDPREESYSLPLTSDADGFSLFLGNKPGTLADYLGIPTNIGVFRKDVENFIDTVHESDNEFNIRPCFLPAWYSNTIWDFENVDENEDDPFYTKLIPFTAMIGGRDYVEFSIMNFGYFLFKTCVGDAQITDWKNTAVSTDWRLLLLDTNQFNSEGEFNRKFIEVYGRSIDDIRQEYIAYVIGVLAPLCFTYDEGDYSVNLLPFWVYRRIIADWYINTNFEDPDTYLANHLVLDNSNGSFFDLADRYWGSDYFTSAFLTPQAGDAVRIPVNGTISDLRSANALQKILERAIYTGKRYIEQVRSFFGARSSDARFDRTEVLGRDVFRINLNDVTQTNQADFDSMLDTPVGQVSSNGLSVAGSSLFHYKAEEHGMIMVLMSIRPKAAYMQGIPRIYLKKDAEDFLWPQYSQVGEQPVYTSELCWDPDQGVNPCSGVVFGFNRRYAEYMYHRNEVHGEMLTSLDYWHSARKFDVSPVLNTEFLKVTDKDQVTRVFNVPDNPGNVVSWLYFDCKCARALPRFIDYDL